MINGCSGGQGLIGNSSQKFIEGECQKDCYRSHIFDLIEGGIEIILFKRDPVWKYATIGMRYFKIYMLLI